MKLLLSFFAVMILVMPQAQATENRMTVTDIHNFVSAKQDAMNSASLTATRNFLNRSTAENAVIERRVAQLEFHPGWNAVTHTRPYYGYAYRYPVTPHYRLASHDRLGKWDNINMVEHKKRTIPGYENEIKITGTTINPYGRTAVVDLDMHEFSLAYNPYRTNLTERVLHANSKCKMYLTKLATDQIVMTRMDCNTNSNLRL